MQVLSNRSFEQGGFTIQVQRILDEDPNLSYLTQDYGDDKDAAKYKAQDAMRLRDYNKGEWYMLGISVEISKRTATNWAKPPVVGRASVWGFESDSDESFLKVEEDNIISEAFKDVQHLKEALCG